MLSKWIKKEKKKEPVAVWENDIYILYFDDFGWEFSAKPGSTQRSFNYAISSARLADLKE